jgi:hypothetical protein
MLDSRKTIDVLGSIGCGNLARAGDIQQKEPLPADFEKPETSKTWLYDKSPFSFK